MKRLLSLVCLALAVPLAACGSTLTNPATAGAAGAAIDATGAVAPAPFAKTLIDEKGVLIALESAEVIATGVDHLVAAGVIVRGSSNALTIKQGLISLKAFLRTASAAQKAGNATTYSEAMTEAAKAFRTVASALNST